MTQVKNIFKYIDEKAPFESALSFDNCGLLVGNAEDEVQNVLVALDITSDVIKEAKKLHANLIISHHPVIFKPVSSIKFNSTVSLLCKYNINAICVHTNLDIAKEGVNFHLAKKLNLIGTSPLTYEEGKPLGLVGNLEKELNCKEFAKHVKKSLDCKGVRYTFERNKKIKKVAVCSGTGGEFFKEAYQKGADALVTGEIKHNQILSANELGIIIVDAGHFKTENVIVEPLKNLLEKQFKNINFYISNSFTDKIQYI